MVMVTKERKKTGCTGGCLHGIMTIFTGGIWLLVGPPLHWLFHRIGPRKKTVTRAYGPPPPYSQPPQPAYAPPGYQPPPAPYPPYAEVPPQQQPQPWQQPGQPRPQYPPRQQTTHYGPPPETPPDDPRDTGGMRRRS